ncbi:MAG: hypothetical protein ACO3MW_01765 [Rhodospirillales bacterium]|jgi:hypothetical protein
MVRFSVFVISMLIAVLLAGPFSSPAAAQMACETRAKITKTLKKDYSELPVSAGLDNAGRMIEVFASKKGSWTILITMPTGVSCLMATGESWVRRELKDLKGSETSY